MSLPPKFMKKLMVWLDATSPQHEGQSEAALHQCCVCCLRLKDTSLSFLLVCPMLWSRTHNSETVSSPRLDVFGKDDWEGRDTMAPAGVGGLLSVLHPWFQALLNSRYCLPSCWIISSFPTQRHLTQDTFWIKMDASRKQTTLFLSPLVNTHVSGNF